MQQFAERLTGRELAKDRPGAVVNSHARTSAKRQVLGRNHHADRNQRRNQLDRLARIAEAVNKNAARLLPVEG